MCVAVCFPPSTCVATNIQCVSKELKAVFPEDISTSMHPSEPVRLIRDLRVRLLESLVLLVGAVLTAVV